jgi:hypothetical protein
MSPLHWIKKHSVELLKGSGFFYNLLSNSPKKGERPKTPGVQLQKTAKKFGNDISLDDLEFLLREMTPVLRLLFTVLSSPKTFSYSKKMLKAKTNLLKFFA